ncbi:methylenetetrahydrofolate dehydrogenase (NADP+) / methenyltetrahydrofolate cyclohydrolase [Alkalithermobacter thermoalcaliphilus JW-YL-7 = DSM 7308]|uniref:Bifunctional protein FolD n=1 Tax=Alkalithermobacter thermoalcaliphilus JW-YL-7 = DSM 7308 TaxID=1121328 RepID=A0A150FP89_CLOPD|nr:Bifunctional protein [[Clostridium] paradoxum JW-YL-7 = DSM 7308]SHK54735.1 methylenetetrahydrofolate dehydrogenase (NADP+) / methenyltetrahydrofolate cyclohydrolase [[Clostridium] paradoxum JW-YL-7 = DSM 7308]
MEALLGKPVADKITTDLIKDVNALKEKGITPKLTIIRVGNKEDDISYEKAALKRCKDIGIHVDVKVFEKDITEEKFIENIKNVNEDKLTHAILVLRPLPKHINEDKIKHIISPNKDVDCFNTINLGKLLEGDKSGFSPCTPLAVIELLKYYNIDLESKNVVVLGRSNVVGKPLSILLLNENATVTICHSKTKNLSGITKTADILVCAVGKAKMINKDFIKNGAIVIDVGINVDEKGKLCGDVDYDSCIEKACMITPVPRGVGSVTTSILAKNIIKATKINENII